MVDGEEYEVSGYKFVTLDMDGIKLHTSKPSLKKGKYVSKSNVQVARVRFDYNRMSDDFDGKNDAQLFEEFAKWYDEHALCYSLSEFIREYGEFSIDGFLDGIEYIRQYSVLYDELEKLKV